MVYASFIEHNHILNFYGYQRFGSKRPVTHLIGKAILQRDFDMAVDLISVLYFYHMIPQKILKFAKNFLIKQIM